MTDIDFLIENMEFVFCPRRTKSWAFEFGRGKIICRVPAGKTKKEGVELAKKNRESLLKSYQKAQEKIEKAAGRRTFSDAEIGKMKEVSRKIIPPVVSKYASLMGVSYNRITIRQKKTSWGSCSSKGNLNFNCFMALLDMSEIEYIVVHELAHRKYMNHSKQFWLEVEKYIPDYKNRIKKIRSIEKQVQF